MSEGAPPQANRRSVDRRTRIIIDTAQDAFVSMDTGGRIVDWNPQAERTFGWKRGEMMGQPLAQTLIPELFREAHLAGLKNFLETGQGPALGKRLEVRALHRDGSEFPVELTISAVKIRGAWLFNAFVHDISERKRQQQELEDLAVKLAQTNRDLRDFVSAVAHDLQEPLRTIQAFGMLLRDEAGEVLTPSSQEYIARMHSSGERMQEMLRGLLEYSRVSSQEQRFTKVDLGEVVREAMADLEARIRRTAARIEVGELPAIEADRGQMRQLLQNLLGNALKFQAPERAPVVSVSAELLSPLAPPELGGLPAHLCRIVVKDNGIGFDPQYSDRIFGLFQRLNARSAYEGSGLGLAICRRIAERHRGSISALGLPGAGATLSVVLPMSQG